MIPFGPYRPDQPGSVPGISRNIVGALPTQDTQIGVSYRPMSDFNLASGAAAIGAEPRGAASVINNAGSYLAFVGTETDIVQLQADYSWASIDAGLSLTADDDWSFAHYGDYLVYTNTTQGMRAYNVQLGGSASAITDAPDARFVFASNETLIALDCDGDNKRWQNAALGNHTNWTTLEANGDTLEDGSALVAGGDLGNGLALVVQKEAVRLFRIGGGQSHISVTKLSDGIGCVGERSFVTFNGVAYWLDRRGFFRSAGGQPEPIGSGKVNKTFLSGKSPFQLTEVQATVDPDNEMVWWFYDDTAWGFNWVVGEWCQVPMAISALFRMATPGYTLNAAGALGTLNALSAYPLNSNFWLGQTPSLAAIDANQKIGFFDGGAMAAELDTGMVNNSRRQMIRSATPLTDDAAATLAIGRTEALDSDPSFGSDIAIKESGRAPIRGGGKNVLFREKHSAGGDWSYARGVDHVEGSAGGFK